MIYDHPIAHKIDTVLSLLAAMLVCFFLTMVVTGLLTDPLPHKSQTTLNWLIGLQIWTLITDGWFIVMMWTGVSRKWEPLAPRIAAAQPRLPWILRPFIGLWWLLHMVLISMLLTIMTLQTHHPGWVSLVLMFLADWGMSYLSIIFLLLTVTAFSRNLNAVLWFWKHRVLWSLGISAITISIKLIHGR
ncbi:MAG: hypothetical protein WCD79_19870 [Chthoniobacteraceae bacterium]